MEQVLIRATGKERDKSKYGLMDLSVMFYLLSVALLDGTIVFKVATVILYGLGALQLLRRPRIPVNLFVVAMGLFIVYNGVLILLNVPEFGDVAQGRLTSMVQNFAVNFILFLYFIEKENRKKTYKGFILIAFVLIAYILVTRASSLLEGRFGGKVPYPLGFRGTNGKNFNPNFVCITLYTALMCVAHLFFSRRLQGTADGDKKKTGFLVFLALTLSAFTVLTGSRAGTFIVAIYLFLEYLLRARSLVSQIKILLITGLVLGVVYVLIMKVDFLYNIVGSRFEVLISGALEEEGFEDKTSVGNRENMIELGMSLFRQRPWFGWGLDNFTKMSPYNTYSHNNFIEVAVSSGVFGFVLYYGGILGLLVCAWRNRKSDDPEIRNECITVIAFLVATVTMNIAHVDYVLRQATFPQFLFAAMAFNWELKRRKDLEREKGKASQRVSTVEGL